MDPDPARGIRRLPRWVIPALTGVVVTVVGVSLLLAAESSGTAACAAPAAPGGAGRATHYVLTSGGGNCSYPGPPADDLYVALGPDEYAAGARCGGYLDVTGPRGQVRVKVVDQCPECEQGHLDLSRTAFGRIGALVDGVIPVTYRAAENPPLPAPLSVRVKEGSSRYWLALLIIDHGNPLTAVQVRGGAGTQALRHVDYNYWIAEPGAGPGPFTVDLTDNAGHRATIPGVTLSPGRIQTSTVRMYGSTPPKVTAAPARPASTAGPSRAAAVSAAASVEAFADAAPSGSARPVAPSGPRRCH